MKYYDGIQEAADIMFTNILYFSGMYLPEKKTKHQ